MKNINVKKTGKNFLYRIHTKSLCDADKSWLTKFKAENVCLGYGCRDIYPQARRYGLDVWVMDQPDISAVNVVAPPGLSFARRDFLDLFSEEVSKYLKLGRVFTSDGTLVEDFVTFVGEKRLPLRGSEDSRFFGFCKKCGNPRYWPQYPWYVLRESLFDQPLYESGGLSGLIITEQLKARIEKGRWKGIYITKLPVLDEPRDGIENMPKSLVF